eukprot:TRINITY_DN8599_c0_g1_i1.p1 TRINITY_DN8599_c0_g1~~TRINITY_DN8599_c0_g1_i1.p1  ORF type:complete len:106 (-),score=8.52 TRINITY_DN8599_c0_g1_i1:50-367(-)
MEGNFSLMEVIWSCRSEISASKALSTSYRLVVFPLRTLNCSSSSDNVCDISLLCASHLLMVSVYSSSEFGLIAVTAECTFSAIYNSPHVLCVDTCLLYTSPSPRD